MGNAVDFRNRKSFGSEKLADWTFPTHHIEILTKENSFVVGTVWYTTRMAPTNGGGHVTAVSLLTYCDGVL